MTKIIGIVGASGRMGGLLANVINQSDRYRVGVGFGVKPEQAGSMQFAHTLNEVFANNDYVVDFSSHCLTQEILQAAVLTPKPLVICTTGWDVAKYASDLLNPLAQKVPVVVAPNTSFGACVQLYLVRQLAKVFGAEYDIDILEKHHRNKIDVPSGTATQILAEVKKTKKNEYGLNYSSHVLHQGPRPEHFIGMNVERSGNLPGEHEVSFTSEDEAVSIKHVAFNRDLFAKGALKILDWLEDTQPEPGIYTMLDVLKMTN